MSVISNSTRPDEGPPTAPPNVVAAPTDIPLPSSARAESNGIGPDRNTLGVVALEAARDAPYKNTRSHKHISQSPTSVTVIQAQLRKAERSAAPTPSTGIKREISLPRTVVDEDQTTYIPPASPERINIDAPSPGRTPRSEQSLLSQLPMAPPHFPPALNPIPENCLPSRAPTPAPPVPLVDISEAAQTARAMYECTLGNAFEDLGKGFGFPMAFPEREAITKCLPDVFSRFQKELHRRANPVEGRLIPLNPHENAVWTDIFAAAHSFASELSHYLGLLGLPFRPDSVPPTPIIPPSPRIPSFPPPHAFSTDKLVSTADAIQAAVFALHGRFITDSNALDIAHNLARAKKALNAQAEARGSTAPPGAYAAPREDLSARADHGTASAYMDAAPSSALGLSLGPQTAGTDPYGPYGQPTAYDSFGQTTNPAPEPLSRAASQITWATSTAPPHETHPVDDSVHVPLIPAPASPHPAPKLPVGPPDIPEFSQVSRNKGKKKNKGLLSTVQTPKMSFAAVASGSLPTSGIQWELAKINKPSSAPASLPSVSAAQAKLAKDKSLPPPGNLDLIIKVSLGEDCQLILNRASMPESRRCLMCLVTHFNNIVNSKEYRGKTSITPVQFSYGTNGNCYISFSPATKIEEVELFRPALASCIGISGPFTIIRAGKWAKLMISHVPVWRVDPITGEERHEVNTKNDLMLLLQLFVPNDLLDSFPVQDVRFLRPLDYVYKTNPGGHKTIVLSVEDKSGRTFSDYTKNGLNFGYCPCYIREFKDKVRLSECMRCSSYECKKPGNCNKPFVCNLCGGSHCTEVHSKHCSACAAQKLTLIPGHSCRCPPKCPACKKDHPFGDLECPTRGRYAPSLSNVLHMEGFTGSRAPGSIHHSPAASGTSARTPRPPTTAPGLINSEVSAPPPPAAIAEEDSEMAATC